MVKTAFNTLIKFIFVSAYETALLKKYLTFVLLMVLHFLPGTAQATHVMGTDFAYECLGNGKYRIILNLYRDCNGIAMSSTNTYRYKCKGASNNGTARTATRIAVTDVTGIDSSCGVVSRCNTNSNFSYGIEQHVYVDTVNLSSLNCCEITIFYSVCCRNNGISTGAAGQNFYSEMTINKCLSACNSSPKYTNYPVAIVCKGQDVVLNSGAVDTIDVGDSLSYELTTSLTGATSNVSYSGSFNYYRPLTFLGFPNANQALPYGFHLDPTTGDLAFRPTQVNQISVVAFKVKEWRKDSTGTWKQIGESRRDLQVIVINCVNANGDPNALPSLATQATAKVCSGDSVCMQIVVSDTDASDTVRLSWNNGIPGASFIIANPGGKRDTALICWRPAVKDTSSVPYSFTITARDNACPFPGSTTRAYAIQVGLKPETVMTYTIDTCGLIEMKSAPKTTYIDPIYTWILTDSSQDTVFQSVSLAKNAYSFLDPGAYYVYHKIETSFPCYTEFYDSFNVAPYPVVRSSLPNDTNVCKYSPLQLSSAVSGGVAPLRYSWNTSSNDTNSNLNLIIDRDTLLVVTVTDKFGCYHRDSVSSIAWDLPESRIHINETQQCYRGNTFLFTDSTTIPIGKLARIWLLGDGDTSSQAIQAKSYSNADTFLIILYSTSDKGCKDTASDSVWVHPQSIPKIQVNDSAQCLWGNAYVFNAKSSTIPYESIVEWYWNFGDTTGDTSETVLKDYSRFGYMDVRLTTETESGCLDSVYQRIRVNPNPIARISINDSLTCLNENEVQLNALASYVDDGYIGSIDWLLGDGNADTGWVPALHTYALADTFLVRMTLLSDQQCGDTTWQKVVIHPQTQIQLLVDSTDDCLTGNQFSFDASGSVVSSGSITQYLWNYNDGQLDFGSQVSHGFSNPDTFIVRLITLSALQCRDTAWQKVIIHPQTSLDFMSNADSQCLNLNSFSFDASASNIAWGSIDSLYWDFGDGQVDTGWTIPQIVYASAGPNSVQLVGVSDYGCRDTMYKIRVAHPRVSPQIQANYFDHCFSFHAFSLDASGSQIPWGSIADYQWNLEDGASLNGIQPAAYSFATPDSFDVRLITTSNYGCIDTVYSEVVVHPQPISAILYNEDQHCLSGNNFRFDATTSTIPTGSISKYAWYYGDGNTGNTALIPNKIYATNGSYVLKLRIESALGCGDSSFHPIIIYPQMKPAIQIIDSFVCVRGNYFDINASSSSIPYGSIQAYQWNFDDGNTQNGVNIGVKNFSYYDTFNIKLKTISDKACSDSIYRKIIVYPQPTARFVVNDSIQCFDQYQNFSFDATSSSVPSPWAGITEFNWISSDADAYSGQFWLNKAFSSRGVYTIELQVKTKDGCRDTTGRQVLYYPAMTPSFSTPDTAQCFNEHAFVFNAGASSIPLGTIQRYTWKYEDNTTGLGLISPAKRFADFDTFTVWLITQSNENCEDSIRSEVIVLESPAANFSVPETCMKQASLFTDLSIITHDTLISWFWDFGDQRTSDEQNPIHYYKAANYYDVLLRVESHNNCFHDSLISSAAWVKSLPIAKFGYERINYDFETVEFQYSDQSTDAITWDWDFGDGQISQLANPIIEYIDTAHYLVQLIVSNQLNCLDTSIQTVWALPEFLLYVPNAFSPNKDEKNEGFAPRASAYYVNYRMRIYDRWGELMFETDKLTETWDGTYKGVACMEGVYVYQVHIVDLFGKGHNLKGNLTLLR